MKVLLISDMVGGPGGAYKYIQQVDSFTSSNIEMCIALDLVTSEYVNKNYKFQSVNFVPLSYKFHLESSIIESIENLFCKYRPDVIHIVNGSIKSNLIIRKYLISKHVPFVVTEQFIDGSLKFDNKLLKEIQEINSETSHTIYVSQSNKEIAQEIFKINSQRDSVIYNAILPIKHKKTFFSQQPYRFYTLARCVPQKGIDIVIKALSKIHTRRVIFDLIGDGKYKTEYIKLADSLLKGNHKFRILGWRENINYSFISGDYDLFISASRQEGLSYSLLEAATLGMPIICSNASGNNELIKMCNCGVLFGIDDHNGLADLLLDFIDNPANLNSKAIKGSEKVDSIFDIKKGICELEKVYLNISIL